MPITDNIQAKTILMLPPLDDKRRPEDNDLVSLVAYEAFLRKKAYRNTTIKVDESFFNDSDMKKKYSLIVVYTRSGIPLLSARYFHDKSFIEKCLQGETSLSLTDKTFSFNQYNEDKIFLADRLSGNLSTRIYRENRKYIFSLFRAEIFKHNRQCTLLLMAREEKGDKLLAKYINWGFHVIGSTIHKGRPHWIVLQDFKKIHEAR
jgi:hypothetical protein